MKQSTRQKHLDARRKSFDDMRQHDVKALGFTKRPGSLKK